MVPLEPFGVPRRAAPLGRAGKPKGLPYTPLPKIMTSAAVNLLQKANLLEKLLNWMDSALPKSRRPSVTAAGRQGGINAGSTTINSGSPSG